MTSGVVPPEGTAVAFRRRSRNIVVYVPGEATMIWPYDIDGERHYMQMTSKLDAYATLRSRILGKDRHALYSFARYAIAMRDQLNKKPLGG